MIIFPPNLERVDWDSDDAKSLKDILASGTFQKALQFVVAEKPSLLDGSHMNKALVASGVVKGFELFLETLFRLTQEQPKADVVHENYPDPDDDSKWDGVNAR